VLSRNGMTSLEVRDKDRVCIVVSVGILHGIACGGVGSGIGHVVRYCIYINKDIARPSHSR
jgi:hypothetical protein